MAMVVNDLADQLANAVQGMTQTSTANAVLGTTASTYVKNNAEFTFNWTGTKIIPPFDVENTTPKGGFVTLVFVLQPSGATTTAQAMAAWKTQFTTSLGFGTYNITEAGYSTAPGLMSTSPQKDNLTLDLAGEADRTQAFRKLSQAIVDWIKQQRPTGPCAGTHGFYSGQGIVSNVE